MLLLYILWDDWPIFMISGSNQHLLQQLEYTLPRPDCHRWSISNMQSVLEDTLEERWAKEFCFKLGKSATGLGLLYWGFKGVQEEIPSEEASTLQIGSVAFPPGQCTSLQFHPCRRLFDQNGHQDSARGVVVIVAGIGHGDMSSNPGRDWLHFT